MTPGSRTSRCGCRRRSTPEACTPGTSIRCSSTKRRRACPATPSRHGCAIAACRPAFIFERCTFIPITRSESACPAECSRWRKPCPTPRCHCRFRPPCRPRQSIVSSRRSMKSCADLRVLFRAPAGARRGFGHLVRCRSLARALGVRPLIALRGTSDAVHTAVSLGCDVVRGPASKLVGALQPDVLVVDDPIAGDAKRWIDAARRAGCVVVSVHDLGLGCLDADLIVDGSVTLWPAAGRGELLIGTRYAVLDPVFSGERDDDETADENGDRVREPRMPQVLIALGGGPRTELAREIAHVLVGMEPRVDVRIAGGFLAPSAPRQPHVTWVGPRRGLVHELVRADVAVVGGGGSLYE